MWQDWVLSGVNWVFIISMIPTILSASKKPALSTSLLTGTGMLAIAGTYVSLELPAAVFAASILGAEWFLLAWQRYRLDRRASKGDGADITGR